MIGYVKRIFLLLTGAKTDEPDGSSLRVLTPYDLLTDGGDGPNRRLRVDVGQTGFFSGREFRTFKHYQLAAAASVYIKAVSPVNLILQGLGLQVDTGHVHLEAYVGVTEGDSFSVALPILGANRMDERPTPYYESQVTFHDGGTFTGGTLLDLITVKAENQSAQSTTQDAAVAGERGLPAGSYYIKVTNQGNAEADLIVRARWEERP